MESTGMRYIYLLKAGEDYYKVGISSNVLNRLKAIQTSNHAKIRIVIAKPVEKAEIAERDLHKWLVEFKADGGKEWFELKPEQAIELIVRITNTEADLEVLEYLTLREIKVRLGQMERRLNAHLSSLEVADATPKEVHNKDDQVDVLYKRAVEVVLKEKRASASLLQRRLRVGYARAARLLDELEINHVVGGGKGASPREVFDSITT